MKTVTVPVEPTEEMLRAGVASHTLKVGPKQVRSLWDAMLAAAPELPSDLTRLRAENEALRRALHFVMTHRDHGPWCLCVGCGDAHALAARGGPMIRVQRLESGYFLVRGNGPCNFAQPPVWPCSEEILRKHAFPEASEEFLRAALRLSREGT